MNGQWWFQYGYYSNNTLTSKDDSGKHADRTRFRQRIRTQIQFIADENLKSMLNLETNMNWGSASNGGLDADSATFVVKHAYLDWTIPNTQTQIRMGIQGIRAPWINFGNPVMDADVAGVTVSSQFTPELGLTVFWARPYDADYYSGTAYSGGKTSDTYQAKGKNSMDDMDIFGFMLPIKTDVVRATPWGMLALIGKDSGYFNKDKDDDTKVLDINTGKFSKAAVDGIGMSSGSTGAGSTNYTGRGRGFVNPNKVDSTIVAWWAGTTFELPILDPFFVKIDAMMGGIDTGDDDSDAFGYLVSADIGYKFSFGALSAIGWYASGDKDKDDRGIMPIISDDGGFKPTRYGTAGTEARSWDRVITGTGLGMWGIGLQLANVSFVDNLSHTARVVYMGGTNEGDSVARRTVRAAARDKTFGNAFLMTSDRAWEINLLNEYKINQNLKVGLDLAYVWLDLGDHWKDKDDTKGSFASMLGVTYSF